MSRLPTPGADTGVWGSVLNDFLLVEHKKDGSLKLRSDFDELKITADSAVQKADSGQPNGYAPLDESGKVPEVHLPVTADRLQVMGLKADGTTDDADTIQTVLDDLYNQSSEHSLEVLVQAPTAEGTIFINRVLQLKTSNTTLRFGSPLRFGPQGGLKIQGELEETPIINKPFLTAQGNMGETTLTVNRASDFSSGDYIVIRGARDSSGNSLQKMDNRIVSISGNTLTLEKPLIDTFLIYNPGTWPNHNSNVTKVVATAITAAANRGDRTVTVQDTSIFKVGSFVQILDNVNTSTPEGVAEPTNYKHREIAEVRQIVSATKIRISHALHHGYDMAQGARVALLRPVEHASIQDATITWAQMSTTNYAIEAKYAVGSLITNCQIIGDPSAGLSWRNQAIRLTDSFFTQVSDCYVAAPASTSGGNGYGITLYGATSCAIRDCRVSSARHSVLFFSGAAGNTVSGCVSLDASVSDYDFHGAECVDNLVSNCTAIGGDSAADDGSTNKAACRVGNSSHADGDFYNVFSGMNIVNFPGIAFETVPQSSDNTFRDSRVMNAQIGVKIAASPRNAAHLVSNTFVENVDFVDVETLINVDGGSQFTVRGVVLDNCRFVRAKSGLIVNNALRAHIRRCTFFDPTVIAGSYAVTGSNVNPLIVKHNDLSGMARGVKLTNCPNARVAANILHDMTETTVYEDAGGNSGALFARNDTFGFNPIAISSGSGPSAGGAVDIARVYLSDTPQQHGFAEWNFDPIAISSGNGTAAVAGTIYLLKCTSRTGGTISNIVTTVGSATTPVLTSGQNFAGIYDSKGVRLAVTADQTTAWATAGVKTMALTSSVTIQAGQDYYIAFVANGSTLPSFVSSAGGSTTSANSNLANAVQRFTTNGSGTSLPANLTLTSNSGVGARAYWAALS